MATLNLYKRFNSDPVEYVLEFAENDIHNDQGPVREKTFTELNEDQIELIESLIESFKIVTNHIINWENGDTKAKSHSEENNGK